jgi:hypothetical protein
MYLSEIRIHPLKSASAVAGYDGAAGAWTLSAHCTDPDRSTAAEKESGIVLACTTRPNGDMEIDL